MRGKFPYLDEKSEFRFPPLEKATDEGIVAIGGNLSPGMLLSAYKQGIFPWYSRGEPILWWSPEPRFVLFPHELHVSKSMRKILEKGHFSVTFNRDFSQVIRICASIPRKDQDGTWITCEMVEAYEKLHHLGYAHSVEVWDGGELVGGLYGVSLGSCFFGESMFSRVSNGSKIALITMVQQLLPKGLSLVDCQIHTTHLENLGARFIRREYFLALVQDGIRRPSLWLAAG